MTTDLLELTGPDIETSRPLAWWFDGTDIALVSYRPDWVEEVRHGAAAPKGPWQVEQSHTNRWFALDRDGCYVAGGREDVVRALVAKTEAAS